MTFKMGMALKISHLKEKLIIQQKTSHKSFFIKITGEGNGNPLQYSCLEIPWTEEPCRLQSMGSQRVRHNWNDWACTRAHTHAYSGFHHSALTKKLLLNSTKDLYVDNAHKHLSTCFTWSKLKLTFLSELPSFQSPHDDSCFILQMSLQLFM